MKNIIISGILTVLLFTGCNGYLDTAPSDGVRKDEAIRTEEDVLTALRGAYDALSDAQYYGADFIVYGDVKGDDVQTSITANAKRTEAVYRFSWTESTAPAGLWLMPYQVISRVNFILSELERGFVPDSAVVRDAKGQALALRALCHFNLLLVYGYPYLKDGGTSLGVPLVRRVLESGDMPARETVAAGYNMVISDLKAAVDLLDEDVKNGYINRWAAKALLARVCLYKGDWNAAFTYAADVMEHGPYSLIPKDEYTVSWAKDFTVESVFQLNIPKTSASNRNLLGYLVSPKGYMAMVATQDLVDLLMEDPVDVRLSLLKRVKINAAGDIRYFIYKYPGRDGNLAVNNMKILRLSDISLIAAEAALKKTGPDQESADKYLNLVCKRANPLLPDVVATEELVLKERRKELFLEGHRFFDAMRLGKTIVREGGFHFLNQNDLISPDWDDYRIVAPIPQAELDANPSIRTHQNPGYK